MNDSALHPAQQFSAPSAILSGTPLKDLLDARLVDLIGRSLANVVPRFDPVLFGERALDTLADRELKDRALHIARAMAEQLPADFDEAAPLLIQSLGPRLTATEGNGLGPFFYFPHSHLIAEVGVSRFDSGMQTNYELTQRFTAEFSIRPYLATYRTKSLKLLKRWAKDPNPHVRRLVSEGTRPRLPWASRLPEFQADPTLALPLLELLKDDPELYVRRSVANHLGDIAKDHPEFAFDVCEGWLQEAASWDDAQRREHRYWLLRHAVRHPAKSGVARAVAIRERAVGRKTRGA